MSKILEATCEAGVVKVGGIIVDAVILSEGVGSSTGVVLIEQGVAYYVASSAENLKSTITSLIDALDQISDAITKVGVIATSIGAGMTGPTTAPPGTLATDVAALNQYVTAIQADKSDLEDLNGELQ